MTEQRVADRRAEIADGLLRTGERIAQACQDAGRDAAEVTLVVITKTFPAEDVRHLHGLGVRDVGESRHPEGGRKAAECADLDLRWHYVGQLQTNKARAVAGYADVVHSVDRSRLVTALGRFVDPQRSLGCLVQVSLDPPGDHGRGGVEPAAAVDLAAKIDALDGLHLLGVMAVAPPAHDPDDAFARLLAISRQMQAEWPSATWVSAGMSGDLEAAIRHGATHVRVGSAILGTRPPAR